MYKNSRHSTEAECRLFCCPILLGRCRFCSFLKLLSYRHTANRLPFCLAELRASRNFIIHHNKVEDLLTLLGVDSREQHAAALKPHHLARGQVDDGDQGLAHQFLGPERIGRSVPVPSSSVKRRSFSLFFTASQALTLTARKSDLQNVSKSTFSSTIGSNSIAGRAAFF